MRLAPLAVALALCCAAAPAARAEVWKYGAAECNQLWFMRNLIMDRAGYCFGSPLGQALYDNDDCSGKDITLSPEQTVQANRIRALEQDIGCRVDTAATTLDVTGMAQLRRLVDMPLPDNGGSACTWAGPEAVLHAGKGPGTAALGRLTAGDRVGFGWIGEGDWTVISASSGGPSILGWIDVRALHFERNCTDWAG
ncbi:DUF4453 domain-containing protein [Rhodovulum sp. 12E13]|uniref:DUF4453 domain-containing protein n=1 Tax=Rhodovulum sp. 12E13 TaxID=2203891 RepID=UPI000E1933BC|nr:DUF4453 domain-containing protein [Rhodovulum sp. 12E13]RDC73418.1 DUF4453 domain-containing protein [Rhodovulum sp. 12E13]